MGHHAVKNDAATPATCDRASGSSVPAWFPPWGQVLKMLSQRRQVNIEDIQAVEEVGAHMALGHGLPGSRLVAASTRNPHPAR